MEVDAAMQGGTQYVWWEDAAVRKHHGDIWLTVSKPPLQLPITYLCRLEQGQTEIERDRFDGGGAELHSAPGGSVRLTYHAGYLGNPR